MIGFLEAFRLIWQTCREEWSTRRPTKHFLSEFVQEMKNYIFLDVKDLGCVLAIAALFTFVRFQLTKRFAQVCKRFVSAHQKVYKLVQLNLPEELSFLKSVVIRTVLEIIFPHCSSNMCYMKTVLWVLLHMNTQIVLTNTLHKFSPSGQSPVLFFL